MRHHYIDGSNLTPQVSIHLFDLLGLQTSGQLLATPLRRNLPWLAQLDPSTLLSPSHLSPSYHSPGFHLWHIDIDHLGNSYLIYNSLPLHEEKAPTLLSQIKST